MDELGGAGLDRVGLDRAGLDEADLAAVDALAEGYQQRGLQPGIAYGVVAGAGWCTPGDWGSAGSAAPPRTPARCSASRR